MPVSKNPQVSLIMESDIFDERYYHDQLNKSEAVPVNSVEHYLATGAGLGLNPHPLFDSAFYLKTYPDVAAAGMNPLVHYILHGASEGRFPNRFFDSAYYLASLSESERSIKNPLTHYLRSRMADKSATHPQFDTQVYCTFYPEALTTSSDPLAHFLEKGADQKRLSHFEFDPQFYLETYKDVAAAGLDPVQHYRLYGRAEGRLPRSAKQRFQSMESFEKVLQAYFQSDSNLHSDSTKINHSAISSSRSSAADQRGQSEISATENVHDMRVYWGSHLFEHRLLEQFIEVARKLPDIQFCIPKAFFLDAAEFSKNIQVLDMVPSERTSFAGCCVFISPVESSPVSELMLMAIDSGLLVVCSDDSEISNVVSPSESSMLPQGVNAEKIVHAVAYVAANRQNSLVRAQAARSKLLAYSN